MDLKLFATSQCPFAQRVMLAMAYKKIPHSMETIDLKNPSQEFLDLSPLQRVPILLVDHQDVIFESSIINEFLDEVYPHPALLPTQPLIKAQQRAWIEFSNTLLTELHWVCNHKNSDHFEPLMARMKALNNRMGQGPYFSGKSLALVDLAFAPFLARFFIAKAELGWTHHFSRLEFWFKSLIEIDCISKIFDSNFNNNYLQSLRAPPTVQTTVPTTVETTQTIRSPTS